MAPWLSMEFLLECIGFPPDTDVHQLARRVTREGEPTPWRGPRGLHLRLPLEGGLEVRLDLDEGEDLPTLWPHFRADRRLRVQVVDLIRSPESPYDVLLQGIANPDVPVDPRDVPRHYPFCTWLTDRRRLPKDLPEGHTLAISTAGFALDVAYLGPNDGVRDAAILERPGGAWFAPLEEPDSPGGCMDVSARVRRVRHLRNPLTGIDVDLLEVDAPERPHDLFVSRWQLDQDGLPAPRPGWRIEGCFVFSGRVAGGLPPARPLRGRSFG